MLWGGEVLCVRREKKKVSNENKREKKGKTHQMVTMAQWGKEGIAIAITSTSMPGQGCREGT